MSVSPQRTLLTLLILLVAGVGRPEARAQGQNQVGLVVQFGEESYVSRCIRFSEAQISGYDVLLRSGLTVEISIGGMGAFVCGIESVGCPATDCMCAYPPNYWSYWHLSNGQWVYSQMGASGYMVSPGSVEGWSWGSGKPPIVIPLEQICVAPATDTPSPTATHTPSPTASATPTPSRTLIPTSTATPASSRTPPPPTATPTPVVTPSPTFAPPVVPTATRAPAPTATTVSAIRPIPPATATPLLPPGTERATETETEATATTVDSATPWQPAFSPSATQTATAWPTRVVVATWTAAPEPSEPSPQRPETGGQKAENLLTWLSVGAGVAYLFFVGLVMLLGALIIFVKLRQR